MGWSEKAANDGPAPRREKGLWLVLGGIVVAGAIGWWRWLRSLPKDR
jgi:hypothetical protein